MISMYLKVVFVSVLLSLMTACTETSIFPPDAILPDGGVYQGDIENGLFQGDGEISYPDGASYKGQFVKGMYGGKGKYTFADGSVYSGDFVNGSASGRIVYTSADGDSEYRGEIKDWVFQGLGKLTNSESTYSGEFLDGNYHGQGHIKYQSGINYTGEFKDGVFSGNGVYQYQGVTYEGVFVDGELSGKGTISDENGAVYIGETAKWLADGDGQRTDAKGNVTIGQFESGYAHGEGQFTGVDGRVYRGSFKYDEFDGQGELNLSDHSVYIGEFNYGRYHGEGELTTPSSEGVAASVKKGRWQNGQLVYNSITRQHIADQAEIALEQHQSLLRAAIDSLEEGAPDAINGYFLGVAGDGTQSVFRREIEFVREQIDQRYATQGRSISLVNHHDSSHLYPLATNRSFATAVDGIANHMNKDNDVLFLYLTSHGSKQHALTLDHDSIKLPSMTADSIGQVLKKSGIEWKVVFVSACYAGGFVPELDDGKTLIFTAADSDNTSFGCSEDSEMTYFAKALFKEVLATDAEINLPDAAAKAASIIEQWETEQELPASNPTITKPVSILQHLSKMD